MLWKVKETCGKSCFLLERRLFNRHGRLCPCIALHLGRDAGFEHKSTMFQRENSAAPAPRLRPHTLPHYEQVCCQMSSAAKRRTWPPADPRGSHLHLIHRQTVSPDETSAVYYASAVLPPRQHMAHSLQSHLFVVTSGVTERCADLRINRQSQVDFSRQSPAAQVPPSLLTCQRRNALRSELSKMWRCWLAKPSSCQKQMMTARKLHGKPPFSHHLRSVGTHTTPH